MKELDIGFLVGLFLAAIIFLITGVCSDIGRDNSWREQIAEHGCAEFYLDQNHERQWRWK